MGVVVGVVVGVSRASVATGGSGDTEGTGGTKPSVGVSFKSAATAGSTGISEGVFVGIVGGSPGLGCGVVVSVGSSWFE